MVLNLVQTNKEPFTADFTITNADDVELGRVHASGKLSSRYADIEGSVGTVRFTLTRIFKQASPTSQIGTDKVFQPYEIGIDGARRGDIYKYGVKHLARHDRSCARLKRDGEPTDFWSVSPQAKHDSYLCGYRGTEQTSLCVCPWITHNDLHPAQIIAVDERAAFEALLAKLYLFATGQFRSGEKPTESTEKTNYLTTDLFLLKKYDPTFKGRHDEGAPLPWEY